MLIGVAAETDPAETRVAATPETVKKFIALGAEVAVERGAGLKAGVVDADYETAGARIVSAAEALGADVVLKVRRPSETSLAWSGTARWSSRPWIRTAIRTRSKRWRRRAYRPSRWS